MLDRALVLWEYTNVLINMIVTQVLSQTLYMSLVLVWK